jgi:hypothetical protein
MVMSRQFPFTVLSPAGAAPEKSLMPYRAQLDWLNFFLADVKRGLGPFIGGSLALTVLAWITLCGLLFRLLSESCWQGPIPFVGLTLILIENAVRSAKAHAKSPTI